MGAAPQVYSPLIFYVIDGARVAYKVFNRADNPEPGAPPIDFPSYQFIEYAGDGKWRSEEDVWVMAEMKEFARRYSAAAKRHPQTLEQQLRREDWGRGSTGRGRSPGTAPARHGWARTASRRSKASRTSTSAFGRTDGQPNKYSPDSIAHSPRQ